MTRIAVWLNTGDHAFMVMCFALTPLLAIVAIGMLGSGTP